MLHQNGRLYGSSGVLIDRNVVLGGHKEVVWYADDKVLRTLTYCKDSGEWIVQGYLSSQIASGIEYPEATIYHRGIGYVEPSCITYALFDSDTPEQMWQEAYSDLTHPGADCPLSEVCDLVQVSSCEHCVTPRVVGRFLFHLDFDGNFHFVNDHVIRRYGWNLDEFLKMSVFDLSPSFKKDWPHIRKQIKKRQQVTIAAMHRDKWNNQFAVEICANFVRQNGNGYICAFVRAIENDLQRRMCEFDQLEF